MIMQLPRAATAAAVAVLILLMLILSPLPRANADESSAAVRGGVDLLQRYPTKLTAGDTRPDQARSWEFTEDDVFRVPPSGLEAGKELRVADGPADLGTGQ